MNKDEKKEKIAIKALELFLTQGYQNVSISDLQNALNMGRGTMYYYFKDKEDLFFYVMTQYFITPKRHCMRQPDNILTSQMITEMLKYLHGLEEVAANFDNKNVNTSGVVTLYYTAYLQFPHLYKLAYRIYEKELEIWKRALRNSIRAGEIRPDIDVETVASLFTHIKDGYDSGRAGVQMDFTMFPRNYYYLFDLIKLQK
jgi:AcrR family transcriptional regulator